MKSIDRGRFTEREREGGIKRKAEMVVIVEREREGGRERERARERGGQTVPHEVFRSYSVCVCVCMRVCMSLLPPELFSPVPPMVMRGIHPKSTMPAVPAPCAACERTAVTVVARGRRDPARQHTLALPVLPRGPTLSSPTRALLFCPRNTDGYL